jgi:hypothetical protein
MSQIVRWSMRPQGDTGKFAVNTDVRDGKVHVVITAHDRNDEFLNFLTMEATAIGPQLNSISFDVKQAAPGRYVGEFDATEAGSYLVVVNPGLGRAAIRSGVSVAYSEEFAGHDLNLPLLTSIAQIAPQGSPAGQLIDAPDALPADERLARLLSTDTYRHDLVPAKSMQPLWPLALLAASVVFLADVFARRVSLGRDMFAPALTGLRALLAGQVQQAAVEQAIERLRSRKAEVTGQWQQRRTAQPFESPARSSRTSIADSASRPLETAPVAPVERKEPASSESDGYLDRLRKAKADARVKERTNRRSDLPTDNPTN